LFTLIKTNMPEIHQFHDTTYDPLVQEAVRFAGGELGLRQIASADDITVLRQEDTGSLPDSVQRHYGLHENGGGYDPVTGGVLVVQPTLKGMPKTTRVMQGSQIVHEVVHSGTANVDEHPYYREALAGMGEAKYMEWLATHGTHKAAASMMLKRTGVELWLPGEMRRVHADEAHRVVGKAHTTQGLVAALGVGYGLHASGGTSNAILRASRPGGNAQYDMMRRSLDTLSPGLSRQVERSDGSTAGIIESTARIEHAARRAGIVRQH
jgi:hypothetical protein